jgi:hypothetical protein
MTLEEDKLEIIREMINKRMKEDMLISSYDFLGDINSVIGGNSWPVEDEQKIVMSCMGGYLWDEKNKLHTLAGVITEYPDGSWHQNQVIPMPSKKIETVQLDAIYIGLTSFFGLVNNPGIPIEIHCHDRIDMELLNNRPMVGLLDSQKRKKESILELVKELPVDIIFKWRPTVSSEALQTIEENLLKTFNKIDEGENVIS